MPDLERPFARGDIAAGGRPSGFLMMSEMEKRFYLEIFGCQMNKLDGELMLGELLRDG